MPLEKRKVTLTNGAHLAVDYVPLDILDAYVTDAKTRWQSVEVTEGHDPGPGGDDGPTHYPPHLTGA